VVSISMLLHLLPGKT